MSENALTSIGPRTFAALSALENLYLDTNAITFIDETAFQSLTALQQL
jgi:anti-anti-sigma regulatory factor